MYAKFSVFILCKNARDASNIGPGQNRDEWFNDCLILSTSYTSLDKLVIKIRQNELASENSGMYFQVHSKDFNEEQNSIQALQLPLLKFFSWIMNAK